jgi:hypothetical protein
MASVLEAEDVVIQHADGQIIPDEVRIGDVEGESLRVHLAVRADLAPPREAPPPRESRFHPGEAPADVSAMPGDRYEEFIREFARLEQHHEFMWAGYVVRELMPRIGFPAGEAKLVLDRLCSEGILRISKVPNPRNPSFPATGVELNYEHPRVLAALEIEAPEHAAPDTDAPGE